MKFIHSADWHIGRIFQNISLLDEQLYVLEQLKQHIKTHRVDVLIIAGDIFDRSVPPADAMVALDVFLTELIVETGVRIIMISGNHDSARRLRFGTQQMQQSGLYILTDITAIQTPIRIESSAGEQVDVYGIPYHEPVNVREAFECDVRSHDDAHTYLVDKIKQVQIDDIPSILISHCFVVGGKISDSERPLSIGGLDCIGYEPLASFDYVALGHLHSPQYKGVEHIRYAGSLLKYSFSESQQHKSVTLVEFDDVGLVSMQPLALNAKHDLRIISGLLKDLLEQAKIDVNLDDYILVRLEDTHDLLEPLAQLRCFYPNILQLEYTKLMLSADAIIINEGEQHTESDVFNDFFQQVTGFELNDSQQALLQSVVLEAQQAMDADV